MAVVAALASALPGLRVPQAEARQRLVPLFAGGSAETAERLGRVFDNAGIATRHLAVPLEWLTAGTTFVERNSRYVPIGVELAARASRRALRRVGLAADRVDHLVFVSTTGLATPSLDAHLANRLRLRDDVARTPIWGLGCAAGAAGLARAAAFAQADPDACVLLIALELCTLTFVAEDISLRNLVASALFADGCAAVVVLGERAARRARSPMPRARVRGAASRLWPDSLDVMGWEITAAGFQVVMSRDIPEIARTAVRPFLEDFLAAHRSALSRVRHFAMHPGGPRVLEAFAASLDLPPASLGPARAVLRRAGNVSSVTCLLILERLMPRVRARETVLVAALGPGFAAEAVLLEGMG
jgi:alkylresorcinol/alkylpyrone synthase